MIGYYNFNLKPFDLLETKCAQSALLTIGKSHFKINACSD